MPYIDEERMPEIDHYKKPRYPIWIEALKVLLLFFGGNMILFYAAYDLAGGTGAYSLYAAGFLLMPPLSVLLRRKGGSLLLLLLPHLAFGYYAWRSPHVAMTAAALVYVLALTLYALVRSMSRQEEKDMSMIALFAHVFIMVILYAVSIYRGYPSYERLLLGQGMVFVVLFFFYQHRTSLLTTLDAIDKDSNFSTGQVIRFNTGMYFGQSEIQYYILYSGLPQVVQ